VDDPRFDLLQQEKRLFSKGPDRLWGPPICCSMGTGFFGGIKQLGSLVYHTPLSRAGLYLHSLFMPSWHGGGELLIAVV